MYNLYEKVATQDGVTFIYDNHNSTFACDMDIAPGVKTVEISMNLDMPYSYKCFSDVEKLIIKENVSTINVPNELFPNVRQVKSQSKHFLSGSCLIGSYFIKKRLYILKNVFHCDKDEAIDLKRVSAIDNYAFRGCKCTNLINTEYIKTWNDVYENAFTGSAFMEQPFVNGVKMAGNIVLAVDDTADEVIIPDDNKNVVFARDVRLSNVKKMIIHKEDSLYNLSYETGLPINLVLKINKPVLNVKALVDLIKEDGRPDDWREFPRKHMEHHSSYVKHLSVLSPYYKEIDGIVYTSDMKTAVIMCNLDIEQIIIPEGVTHISYQAFSQSQLKTIKLPDSLTVIGEKAFLYCNNLKSIILPNKVKCIKESAFECSNLESITLNEGLEEIGAKAFCGSYITNIYIPTTIKRIGEYFLNACPIHTKSVSIFEITSPKFHEALIPILVCEYHTESAILKLNCAGKCAYIPLNTTKHSKKLLNEQAKDFFSDSEQKHCEFWNFARTLKGKEDIAFLEYKTFGSEKAKKYIKKNLTRFIDRLITYENDNKKAIELLESGFASQDTLKEVMSLAKARRNNAIYKYTLKKLKK